MPGGSVNGRPFRESRDSYSRTGIPCGNPRRFQSHDVVRMEAGQRSRSRPIDGPLEKIETEGQKQLQAMLHRQIETKVTIQQQLGQKREFSRGVEYHSSTDDLIGTRSLEDYLDHEEVNGYIEEMKSLGLSHEEILFKLQMENKDSMNKKSKFSNPDYNEARLVEINEKIARKKQTLSKPDNFSNIKPLSRHEMELESAITTANPQNQFLHNTLIKARGGTTRTSPNDPMHDLPEILEHLTRNRREVSSCKKNGKDKSYKEECTLECCKPSTVSHCSKCNRNTPTANSESEACSSHDLSDLDKVSCDHKMEVQTCAEKPVDYVPKEVTKGKKETKLPQKSICFTVRCSKSNKNLQNLVDTHVDGVDSEDFVNSESTEDTRVLDNVEAVPEDVIRHYKLSATEVKQIPRFETYSPGEPTNVLFVKNLSPKVTEEDLASLFLLFQEDEDNRIVFKLLTGRMKGQAFVTFRSVETASKALELVHGYDFKGKPVIVQYGRKSV